MPALEELLAHRARFVSFVRSQIGDRAAAEHMDAETTTHSCCLNHTHATPAPTGPLAASTAPGPSTYTCPMHPEIARQGPGSCPICGMALEPQSVTLDDAPNPGPAEPGRIPLPAAAAHAPDLERMHGTNERIAVSEYENAIRTYRQRIVSAGGP